MLIAVAKEVRRSSTFDIKISVMEARWGVYNTCAWATGYGPAYVLFRRFQRFWSQATYWKPAPSSIFWKQARIRKQVPCLLFENKRPATRQETSVGNNPTLIYYELAPKPALPPKENAKDSERQAAACRIALLGGRKSSRFLGLAENESLGLPCVSGGPSW